MSTDVSTPVAKFANIVDGEDKLNGSMYISYVNKSDSSRTSVLKATL